MSRTDISFLTIRVFAIYAWFSALQLFVSGSIMASLHTDTPAPDASAFSAGLARSSFFIPGVFFAILGVALFVASRPLSRFILQPAPPIVEPSANTIIIARALFSAVGIGILLQDIPRLLDFPILSWKFQHNLPATLADCGQIVLGFLLFLRPHWFTRFSIQNNTQ